MLPDDYEIYDADWDYPHGALRVYIQGSDLPVVELGGMTQTIYPRITISKIDGKTIYTWSFKS